MLQLGMFFKENGFKTPISQTNNPYTFAMHTNGESMWEYMSHFPERASAFNSAMQAQTQAASTPRLSPRRLKSLLTSFAFSGLIPILTVEIFCTIANNLSRPLGQ